MAQTPSNMIPLGTLAPDINLPDVVTGKTYHLSDQEINRGLLVMFICNHCPYVKHVLDELISIGNYYISKGIKVIAISSNDVVNYPDDSPEKMKELAIEMKFPFPYLYDESQEVAKAYDAACTPDFYIFDKYLKLIYRGQLDSARPRNDIPVSGKDIRSALDNMLLGNPVSELQIPSIGCNIKWK